MMAGPKTRTGRRHRHLCFENHAPEVFLPGPEGESAVREIVPRDFRVHIGHFFVVDGDRAALDQALEHIEAELAALRRTLKKK